MQVGPLHETLKPLSWIIGKWKSISAIVDYPSMKAPVKYCEDLTFDSIGHPLLNYKSITWSDRYKYPMHLESGYVGMPDECSVIFLIAQNFWVVTLEEGTIGPNLITLNNSKCIEHTKFARKEVVSLVRIFKLNEKGQLEYTLKMTTIDQPITNHVRVLYEKACKK